MSKQYLYKVSILNRKNSHPLEAICYYSGENQYDIINGKQYISNTKEKVIWNNILIPSKVDNIEKFQELPEYLKFRSAKKDLISNARNILWQNIYKRETREDAQFSRIFEISIPSFFSSEKIINLVEEFGKNLVNLGMIVDASIHSRDTGINVSLLDRVKGKVEEDNDEKISDCTGFLICTLRDYKNGMFINKNRDWNSKKTMEELRYKWVEILAKSINDNDVKPEDKKSWEEKLSIYSEYEKIKMIQSFEEKKNGILPKL